MGLVIDIDILAIIVAIAIVVSKFFDCWTTSIQITNPNQEQNPIARNLFKIFGSQRIIWTIFVATIMIVGTTLWILFGYYDSVFYKFLYLIIGLMVTVVQFAVAQSNKTKKLNYFTKVLIKKYSKHE